MKKVFIHKSCLLYRNEKTTIKFVLCYHFFLITETYLEIFRHRPKEKNKYVTIISNKHCHFYLKEVFGETFEKIFENRN